MYHTPAVANTILQRFFIMKESVTNKTLNAMMYVIASEYAKKTGQRLLKEPFLTSFEGPRLYSLHNFGKWGDRDQPIGDYLAQPISTYLSDSVGETPAIHLSEDPAFWEVFHKVWGWRGKVAFEDLISEYTTANMIAVYDQSETIKQKDLMKDTSYIQFLEEMSPREE